MSRGEVAALILKAIMRGDDYPPPGAADTPENRRTWETARRQVEEIAAAGGIVDIPSDWAQ